MASHQESPVERLVLEIQRAMQEIIEGESRERTSVTHHGAVAVDPKHAVYCICVETDSEKKRLEGSWPLRNRLFRVLVELDYPETSRDSVRIVFESQETVDRDSGGNWYHHWK